jgi:hypothetical protein
MRPSTGPSHWPALELHGHDLHVAVAHERQLLRVEAAHREVDLRAAGQRAHLLEAVAQVVRDLLLNAPEEVGRRDVVVEQGLAALQGLEGEVDRRADGEVEQGHIARAQVARGRLDVARVLAQLRQHAPALAVDLGGEAPGPEQVAQHARLVADRVALGKAGDELVEGGHGGSVTRESVIRDP